MVLSGCGQMLCCRWHSWHGHSPILLQKVNTGIVGYGCAVPAVAVCKWLHLIGYAPLCCLAPGVYGNCSCVCCSSSSSRGERVVYSGGTYYLAWCVLQLYSAYTTPPLIIYYSKIGVCHSHKTYWHYTEFMAYWPTFFWWKEVIC